MIPKEELAAIKTRYEKATPGPWRARGIPYGGRSPEDPIVESTVETDLYEEPTYVCQTAYDMLSATTFHDVDADTEFIAHAREDIPRLVEEVERLRQTLANAGAMLGELTPFCDGTEGYGDVIDVLEEIRKELGESEKKVEPIAIVCFSCRMKIIGPAALPEATPTLVPHYCPECGEKPNY